MISIIFLVLKYRCFLLGLLRKKDLCNFLPAPKKKKVPIGKIEPHPNC